MENKKRETITFKILLIFMLVFAILLPCFEFTNSTTTSATSADLKDTYSYVLDDLSAVSDFDTSDYPVVEDDYTLRVIQIAESSDGELFVYVYQPSEKLIATRVSMSVDEGEKYILYNLDLLNSSGVFFKYKLSNFVVSSQETRNYNVASIYRKWNSAYDGPTETELEKAFKVGQTMKASGFGPEATFEYKNVEVVEITSKIAANVVSVKDSFFSWANPTENGFCSHVVAFSTELPIDQIFEAEVYAEYHYSLEVVDKGGIGYIPEDINRPQYSKYVSLEYDEIATVSKRETTYTFNRIMKVSDYLSKFGDDLMVSEDFSSLEWVLCISEAPDFTYYSYTGLLGYHYTQIGGTLLDAASILRLKFDMGGITYDLGVVDNISSSKIYGNVENDDWLIKLIIGIIIAIVIIVLVVTFAPNLLIGLFNLIVAILTKIFEIIKKILTAPFKSNKNRRKYD